MKLKKRKMIFEKKFEIENENFTRPPREVESKADESAKESIFETISTEIQLQPERLNDTAFSNIETETFS